MDDLLRIALIIFGQLALLLLLYFVNRRRGHGANHAGASKSGTKRKSPDWQTAVWMIAGLAVLGAAVLFFSPWSSWYLARQPPVVEHRTALIETASRELSCPAEKLAITPSGDSGAQVEGCGRKMGLCWGGQPVVNPRPYEGIGWVIGWSTSACYTP